MFALNGAIITEASPVSLGGTANLMARWERFVETARPCLAKADPLDSRVWRFLCAPGIFDDCAIAGLWRTSQTSTGQTHPLALLIHDGVPAPDDPWFDTGAQFLNSAMSARRGLAHVDTQLRALPAPHAATPPDQGARFWIDDWEVHELYFATIQDLAADGFAQMLAPRPVLEDA